MVEIGWYHHNNHEMEEPENSAIVGGRHLVYGCPKDAQLQEFLYSICIDTYPQPMLNGRLFEANSRLSKNDRTNFSCSGPVNKAINMRGQLTEAPLLAQLVRRIIRTIDRMRSFLTKSIFLIIPSPGNSFWLLGVGSHVIIDVRRPPPKARVYLQEPRSTTVVCAK